MIVLGLLHTHSYIIPLVRLHTSTAMIFFGLPTPYSIVADAYRLGGFFLLMGRVKDQLLTIYQLTFLDHLLLEPGLRSQV